MSSSRIQLIVGLANPGKEYEDTRHNAGAWFVDELLETYQSTLKRETKFHGRHTLLHTPFGDCHILIPSTFMNLSGQAVRACMDYLKIGPESLLVAHDEIDHEAGSIKLKFDGGDGGHNGLKDIIRHLNTKKFYRLRIGVGHPGQSKDVADYVLSNPSKSDRKVIDNAIDLAEDIVPLLLQGEIAKAMQQLNTGI